MKRGMYPEMVKKAVRACIQEEPTEFLDYMLSDPGAWPEPPIVRKIVLRVSEPWRPELDERQKEIVEKTLMAARQAAGKSISASESQRKRRENSIRFLELLGIKTKNKTREEK